MSMIYIDVATILKKYETQVQNLEANDDTTKHVRALKAWLLAEHKKSQILTSLFSIVPSVIYLVWSKRSLFARITPIALAFIVREQMTMIHLQRKFLHNFDNFKQRLTGDIQSYDTFDRNQSELAKDVEKYFKNDLQEKQ